jgi:3-hydroxyisobutyrate dehydrogenase-like beta-hydroxyacid dehydrogenase
MVASPVEAVQGDAVLTMRSDDDAIRSTLIAPGVPTRARRGLVHVVTSTISVAFARGLVAAHEEAGIGYVSAPVLGRPDVAAKGELNLLVAGAPLALATVPPLLEVIGGHIWEMGDEAPTANAAKIACHMMIAMAIEAMAEAAVLTEPNGLQRERFFDVILNTLFDSRSYQVYSANISGENYEPVFKETLGLRDLRLAAEASHEAGRTLPMSTAAHGRMADTVAVGLGDRDWSATVKYTIEEATIRPAAMTVVRPQMAFRKPWKQMTEKGREAFAVLYRWLIRVRTWRR